MSIKEIPDRHGEPPFQAYLKVGIVTMEVTTEICISAEGSTKKECLEIYDKIMETAKPFIKKENTKERNHVT